MGSWVDHGIGGSEMRPLEARHNAASQVAVAGVVSVLVAWVALGRIDDDGLRAVDVEGSWYAVLCLVPPLAVVAAGPLVGRGLLRWVWVPAVAVGLVPLITALGSGLLEGPADGHAAVVAASGLHLLALPLLVGAAVTGRDAVVPVLATAAAVLGFLAATSGADELVWGRLVWLTVVAAVAGGTAAVAGRRAALAWASALAVVALPVLVGLAAVPALGVARVPGEVLARSLWFLPALVLLVAAAWRETTNPLAGLRALTPDELRVARRRTPPAGDIASDPVPAAEAHR